VGLSYQRKVWALQKRNGEKIKATLLGDSYLSQLIMILRFRQVEGRKTHTVILCQDSSDIMALRQLRVHLF